ncbi:hypothetical protein L1987_08322 [Smallanthus sonchifolius]|uniref:Uncharacterized protein n=1 Tax=Smallanthus sonchifolius TaxID=185202 RepID=A0ACB9JKR1_9ASTR|nr:hypothetical protein L1987_08322 [Smallanthus sonchifolius]
MVMQEEPIENQMEEDGFDYDSDHSREGRTTVGIERISPITGRKYYRPDVPLSIRPEIGMIFLTLDEAFRFYDVYAKTGGFTVRKNTQVTKHGLVTLKYFVCSKEGQKFFCKVDTLSESNDPNSVVKQRRNRPSIRTGCQAHLRLQLCHNNQYKVYGFVEDHNHIFVDSHDYQFLSAARKLSYNKEDLIYSLSKLNIGPVKSFNIMRTHYGGFDKTGVTAVDCKNFKRDINTFIGKYDADMVVKRLLRKKQYIPDFSCDYFNGPENSLAGLFWADQEMKRNYTVFGDVVSFDATYRSNKYDMLFVPFTGIDNHHRNVTFGAALLGSETADTYIWLLRAFKKAFGREPLVVVTDQDPAMKKAIQEVFTMSRHRLCMWHIMQKLAEKVGRTLRSDESFKKQICNIVWNDSIEPDMFETKWKEIITKFNLSSNKWLNDIFGIRDDWIPAYYRHEHMSGLMRTTSRSESENHFFGQVTNSRLTLVEFLTHFESAIEAQRYKHRKNDHDTRNTKPDWITDYELEREADEIYTRNIFNDVQSEIYEAVHHVTSLCVTEVGDFARFSIKDLKLEGSDLYQVLYREEDMVISCSCNRYEQYGLLCRHIFYVLRLCEVKVFPKNYVLKRWTRDAVPKQSVPPTSGIDVENENVDGVQGVVREIMSSTENLVNRLVHNMDQLVIYRDELKGKMVAADASCGVSQPIPKADRVAKLLGYNQPEEPSVYVPSGIRTKGCGSKKRFKPIREQVANKPPRRPRACHICGSEEHDRRTCKEKNADKSAN